MKKLLLSILLLSSIYGFSQENKSMDAKKVRQKQIENINNPALWDMKRVKEDIEAPVSERNPFYFGAFPVPHYNKLGAYGGGGFLTNALSRSIPKYRLHVNKKEVLFNSYFIGDSPFYNEKQRNRSIFTIITVIDTVDAKKFAINPAQFISRNHPDYGGQGSIVTKNNKIDYVAFTTPDKGSFAIINMRLFHLEYGDIILITPQKDGSFRSLQIQGEKINQDAYFYYIKDTILKRKDVVTFLTDDGVIESDIK